MRLIVLALAIMLAGCAEQTPEPTVGNTTPTAGTGSIEGFVVDDSFRPVAWAIVTLSPLDLQAISNENGEFAFTNLPPGQYILTVTAQGHKTSEQRATIVANEQAEVTLSPRRVFSTGDYSYEEEFVLYIDCEIYAATTTNCSTTESEKELELSYFSESPEFVVIQAEFSSSGDHQIRITQDGLIASAQFGSTGGLVLQQGAKSPAALLGENQAFDVTKSFQLVWKPVGALADDGFDGFGATVGTKADISVTILTAGLDPADYCNSC